MSPAEAVVAVPSEARPHAAEGAVVSLATSRLAALHAHLRRASAGNGDDAVPAALRPAVRAYRVTDAALPQAIRLPSGEERVERGPQDRTVRERYWRVLEAAVFPSSSIDELRRRGAGMTTPIGGGVRADVVLARVADALAAGWDAYGHEIWPAASLALADRTRWWAELVAPRSAATVAALRRVLGVSDAVPVPRVLAVPAGPEPGVTTSRALAGPLVVVDVGRHGNADLVEVVFQAMAQALDAAAPGAGTLGTLRTTLGAAAVPADVVEQTVHATIITLAASVTREQFDGLQGDVGEGYGAYARGGRRFHDAVDGPLRALWAGRVDAVGFARWVAEGVSS